MNFIDPSSLSESHSSRWSSESFASTTLSSVHIAQAIQRSDDDGATLMFSKMNISNIGAAAAEELAKVGRERPEDESPLKRIALGNNRLTILPMEFALLSQLRYLNLKRNNFSVFPEVLTLMSSLDTLDISHNRIKKLPVEAGHLMHLRVFSLSRNKITQLPPYLSQFSNLEVLQVERNPLEWPPKAVMEKADSLDSRSAMKDWVRSLQGWIEEDCRSRIQDSSGAEEQEVQVSIEENCNSWKFPLREDKDFTSHNRSFSLDSSVYASPTSYPYQEPEITDHLQVDHPFHLHHDNLGTFSGDDSPTLALENYFPGPADSEFFSSNMIPTSLGLAHDASYSTGSHFMTPEKKSLPDLQNTKLEFSSEKNTGLVDVASASSSSRQLLSSHGVLVSTPPQRKDSESSLNSHGVDSSTLEMSDKFLMQASVVSQSNSYFKRLSTGPVSTALSQPFLCLIECARSILFAMGQVLQTLEYLVAHAIDDRVSSVLQKVLDPATADMTQLINSLERFDATSHASMPSPMVCRCVLESCRNTVAVFGKAVGVLALQLQAIVIGDDARYSRWILLELYGATAELASAWETIVPHIEAIRPILHSKMSAGQQPSLILHSFESDVCSASPVSLVPLSSDIPSPSLRTRPGVPRTTRRHAGSFSSKDVEIGKKLPSYDDVPGFGGVVSGTARSTPTPRAPKRQATLALTSYASPSQTSSALSSATLPSAGSVAHSRRSSQASIQTSSSSSPLVSTKANYMDLPSNSKLQVDKEALQAVQAAVSIAPSIWDMIATLFEGDLNKSSLVHDALRNARIVTTRLAKTLEAKQVHDFDVDFDREGFREDAHGFLKIVVQLSNIIKTYKGPKYVPSTLRAGMVKLTNSTEEFAILLHVSSLTPSTPRPYTSLVTNPPGPEDLRLDSSLSRDKSVYHYGSFKSLSNPHDGSHSALLLQTFKSTSIGQLRSREGIDNPMADPG